jgi:hypothetical protein
MPSKRGLTQRNALSKYTTECREKKWIVSEKKDLTIKLFYITTHNTIMYTCQFLYLLVGMAPIFACLCEQLSVFKCRNNEQVLQISITILKTKAVPVHNMKAYRRSRDTALLILNLGTRLDGDRRPTHARPQTFSVLNRWLGGPQSRSGRVWGI